MEVLCQRGKTQEQRFFCCCWFVLFKSAQLLNIASRAYSHHRRANVEYLFIIPVHNFVLHTRNEFPDVWTERDKIRRFVNRCEWTTWRVFEQFDLRLWSVIYWYANENIVFNTPLFVYWKLIPDKAYFAFKRWNKKKAIYKTF